MRLKNECCVTAVVHACLLSPVSIGRRAKSCDGLTGHMPLKRRREIEVG